MVLQEEDHPIIEPQEAGVLDCPPLLKVTDLHPVDDLALRDANEFHVFIFF
jgi:hypothetical protein